MTKKRGKLKLPSKKRVELGAFDKIADLITSDEQAQKTQPSTARQQAGGYEIYSFLELENSRLTALDKLFSTKTENIKNYSQINKLIERQKEKILSAKEFLTEKFLESDSALQMKLSSLWNESFK